MESKVEDEVEVVKQPKKKSEPGLPTLRLPAGEVPIGVRLGDLRGQVEEVCEQQGLPLATFIREAVSKELTNKPDLARRALLRSLAITAAQFERALEVGALKGTEPEEQADEVRRFFAQFIEQLKVEPEHEPEEE